MVRTQITLARRRSARSCLLASGPSWQQSNCERCHKKRPFPRSHGSKSVGSMSALAKCRSASDQFAPRVTHRRPVFSLCPSGRFLESCRTAAIQSVQPSRGAHQMFFHRARKSSFSFCGLSRFISYLNNSEEQHVLLFLTRCVSSALTSGARISGSVAVSPIVPLTSGQTVTQHRVP